MAAAGVCAAGVSEGVRGGPLRVCDVEFVGVFAHRDGGLRAIGERE